jgi:hypothetical protein
MTGGGTAISMQQVDVKPSISSLVCALLQGHPYQQASRGTQMSVRCRSSQQGAHERCLLQQHPTCLRESKAPKIPCSGSEFRPPARP